MPEIIQHTITIHRDGDGEWSAKCPALGLASAEDHFSVALALDDLGCAIDNALDVCDNCVRAEHSNSDYFVRCRMLARDILKCDRCPEFQRRVEASDA